MASVPVPNTAEVEIRQMLFGQLIENTLYFVITGEWDVDGLSDLATAVGAWFIAEVLPNLSNQLSVREVLARDLSTGAVAQGLYVAPPNAGGIEDESMPGNVAAAVSLRTALQGRAYRGRNYIAGLPESAVSSNTFDPATLDPIVAAYNILMGTYVSAAVPGSTWVVVSRQLDGVPRSEGVATPVVAASLTDYFIDSQRKRLTGRGQ